MKRVVLALFLWVPFSLHGLEVVPDSMVKRFVPNVWTPDSIVLHNRSAADIRVDSISIRFLDGDTAGPNDDFNRCQACPPGDLTRHAYTGWVYWMSPALSLRYLEDSLYLLDTRPGPHSFLVPAHDSLKFPVAPTTACCAVRSLAFLN